MLRHCHLIFDEQLLGEQGDLQVYCGKIPLPRLLLDGSISILLDRMLGREVKVPGPWGNSIRCAARRRMSRLSILPIVCPKSRGNLRAGFEPYDKPDADHHHEHGNADEDKHILPRWNGMP